MRTAYKNLYDNIIMSPKSAKTKADQYQNSPRKQALLSSLITPIPSKRKKLKINLPKEPSEKVNVIYKKELLEENNEVQETKVSLYILFIYRKKKLF